MNVSVLTMQVSSTNDVKIYNLSAGKSLPEWLTERKRRQLVKNDIEVRKRIELIQDFEMPAVSDCVRIQGICTQSHLCLEIQNVSRYLVHKVNNRCLLGAES